MITITKEKDYHGFRRIEFPLNGHNCIVVFPENAREDKPWVYRAEFLGAFDTVDVELLNRGWHLVTYQISNLFGCPESVELMKQFYDFIVPEFGLSPKCDIFGFSRGGLYAMNFALAYPECVDKIYLDAPVLDVTSWPGGMGKGIGSREHEWGDCLTCYGETEDSIFDCLAARPVKRGDEFASLDIPLAVIAGNADETVPYDENAMPFINDFLRAGGKLYIRVKPACGHHPHSFEDPKEIRDLCDFLTKQEA